MGCLHLPPRCIPQCNPVFWLRHNVTPRARVLLCPICQLEVPAAERPFARCDFMKSAFHVLVDVMLLEEYFFTVATFFHLFQHFFFLRLGLCDPCLFDTYHVLVDLCVFRLNFAVC